MDGGLPGGEVMLTAGRLMALSMISTDQVKMPHEPKTMQGYLMPGKDAEA